MFRFQPVIAPASSRTGSHGSATPATTSSMRKKPDRVIPAASEDLTPHVVAVRLTRCLLDHEPEEEEPAVAVATPLTGSEVRRLEREVGQVVRGLDLGVVGLVDEQVFVPLARLLVGVVGDARAVAQQVTDGDRRRDRRALEPEVVDRGRIEVEVARRRRAAGWPPP